MCEGCYALGYINKERQLKVFLFNQPRTREIFCGRLISRYPGIVITFRDGYGIDCMIREVQIDRRVTFIDGEFFVTGPARAVRNGNYPKWDGSEFKKPGLYHSPLKARLFRKTHPGR